MKNFIIRVTSDKMTGKDAFIFVIAIIAMIALAGFILNSMGFQMPRD